MPSSVSSCIQNNQTQEKSPKCCYPSSEPMRGQRTVERRIKRPFTLLPVQEWPAVCRAELQSCAFSFREALGFRDG